MKMLTLKAVFLLFILALGYVTNAQHWQMIPTGATEDIYNIYCLDENTLFACGQNGVIFKSEDGGVTWQEKHRETGIDALSVSFSNNGNGYCLMVGGQFYIIKTEDYGETWSPVTHNCSNTKFVEMNRDFGTAYWTEYGKPAELHLTNSDVVFISQIGYLYRSTDGGATFEFVDLGFYEDSKVFACFDESHGVVIGCEKNHENVIKIWITDDYGETWENKTNCEFSSCVISSVCFKDEDHIKIYGEFYDIDGHFHNIIETINRFETITMTKSDDLNTAGFFDIDFADERGCYITSIEWDKDPYIESGASVSEDGGMSWCEASHGLDNGDFMYDVTVCDTTFLIASQKGKIYKFDNSPLQDIEENHMEISIFPNPAQNTVSITFPDGAGFQSVEIHAIDGRLVQSQISNFETVNMSNLESGVYIMKVNMADGRNYTERILKE